jgi:23S rRNA (adenine2503-C2)-methyltransferase
MKKNIRNFDKNELIKEFELLKLPSFRAKQVYQWLWKNRILDFQLMSNISKDIQSLLTEHYEIPTTTIDIKQVSADGTIKVGFKTFDNEAIEGVIIPAEDRITACISSQVGCTLSCTFCATGFLPRKRNLWAWEIYDQVFLLNQLAMHENEGDKLTNIVYMGMGEPLLNFDEVVKSLHILNDEREGLGIGAKRITISTSGIARNIIRLADEGLKINLALSLHAANNATRNKIMDINVSNPLETVITALKYFYEKTHNKISYEYILLSGVNDSVDDAVELATLCKDFPVFVNLIEYNPVQGAPYYKTKEVPRNKFLDALRKNGVDSKVRKSRGKDIDAACGQLANKLNKTVI